MSPSSDGLLETANALTSSGLAALGFSYVNLDDGIVEVDRDAAGDLVPTPAMGSFKNLSDALHAQGFKFVRRGHANFTRSPPSH
jgi:alpha-galactosidase